MEKIRVENLTFSYDKETNAVEHAPFLTEEGNYTTIIGHDGSGKSTVVKLLIGLLDKDQGYVYVDQDELSIDTLYDTYDKVGIVFQNSDSQFIGATVVSDIVFGLENHQMETEEMQPIIECFVQKVKMTEHIQSEPTKSSGGQKQRVTVAGVLTMSLQILIFDGSIGILDPQRRAGINELIREIHKESNMTIISITHDIEEVSKLDYVIVVDGGHMIMKGLPNDILRKEKELIALQLDVSFALRSTKTMRIHGTDMKDCTTMEKVMDEVC